MNALRVYVAISVEMYENPFWFSSASLQSVSNLKAEGADQKALLERVDSNVRWTLTVFTGIKNVVS